MQLHRGSKLTHYKADGGYDYKRSKGHTYYDALRIIENENGIFIKSNDATFARPQMTRGSHLYWSYASDCTNRDVTSTCDLRNTDFEFNTSITSYVKPRGWNSYGEGRLSSNNQVLTVRSKGNCGQTYIEDSPYRSEHLIQIQFVQNNSQK